MLRKLATWGLVIAGFVVIGVPAVIWGQSRGITGISAWVLVIVVGGLGLILIEILGSAVFELTAAWVVSKVPEPLRRGLGKQIGGPLILLGLLSVVAAVFVALVVITT